MGYSNTGFETVNLQRPTMVNACPTAMSGGALNDTISGGAGAGEVWGVAGGGGGGVVPGPGGGGGNDGGIGSTVRTSPLGDKTPAFSACRVHVTSSSRPSPPARGLHFGNLS